MKKQNNSDLSVSSLACILVCPSEIIQSKCSKSVNTFLFLFSNKMLVIRAGIHKCLSEMQTGKTLIRLLLQKQSDLGLHCLSLSFWQVTSVQNIRTFTGVFFLKFENIYHMRAQWLSGRVLNWRLRGRGFEPHRRHCIVSLSKTH